MPHQSLASLWDMLDRYAFHFSRLTAEMVRLEQLWPNSYSGLGLMMTKPEDPEDVTFGQMRMDMTKECLNGLAVACGNLGLHSVGPEIARLMRSLEFPFTTNIHVSLEHLRDRIRDELASEWFLHVRRDDAKLYDKPALFGELVASRFDMVEDIRAAGNCLAVGEATACVFHLMRIMERGVHILGRALKVKFDPAKQSWFEICNHASKAVTNRPAKTAKQRAKNAALGAAVAHLQTVRLAWRNEVMHPKQTYTADEAREVLLATRSFMTDLAELV